VGVSDVYSKSLLNADIQTIQTSLVVPLSPHYPSDIVLLGSFVEGNRVGNLVIKEEEEQGEKGLVKKKSFVTTYFCSEVIYCLRSVNSNS